MASLVERNGYYYAQFFDSRRTPRQRRISLRTTRKAAARRQLSKWEQDLDKGLFDPWTDDPWTYDEKTSESISLERAFDRFIEAKERTGRTEATVRTYREVFRLLMSTVGGGRLLKKLRPQPLKRLIWDATLADATKAKRYGHLRTFFRWCREQGLVDESPLEAVTKPQRPDKLPKAITRDQLNTLCSALRRDYERKRAKNWVQRGDMIWRIPLFQFAYVTGMRGSELGRLRWGDIDEERHLIYIREQKNQKEQTIPLNARARAILKLLRLEGKEEEDFVFVSPTFTGRSRNARNFRERASEAFRKARREAGLPEHLSFHSLRHGFCTALAEAGKSAVIIKEAARHADIQTSMRYVHMANERLKAEVEDVFGDSGS